MPLDDRVKGALERSSTIVGPDLRRDLSIVRRKTRRAVIRQRVGTGVLLLVMIVAGVFLGPGVLDVIRSQRHVPAATPSAPVLSGTYQADLSGVGVLASKNLAGPWQIRLSGDGSVLWEAPQASGVSEGVPNDTYHLTGSSLVTSMFARDLCRGTGAGSYTFTTSTGSLTFSVVSDACDVRRAVLTSVAWDAV